ncbi:MAG: PLP-dependent aminotransferase family protein [Cytophagaceae bacterium]|jgi:2-aminoadipate transaminase|nr:PLP-dependent aminotransferase family protein [Cytophagaceae bacterium]
MKQNHHQHLASRLQHIPTSFIREILQVAQSPGVISFAGGIPDESLFPIEEITHILSSLNSNRWTRSLQYQSTEGNSDLRKWISRRYQQKGADIHEEQILITNGSQQGLDLIGKLFLNKNTPVLVEGPTYLGAIQCFSQYESRFLEIPLQNDGINIESLKRVLWSEEQHIPFMYLIPDFQNPSGTQYSLEKRQELGNIAQGKEFYLIEDAPYADISFQEERLPSMLELFPEQTIQLGSFSKTLCPGLRMGWIVAPREIIPSLKLLKQASDLHSNGLSQEIIVELLHRNVYDAQMLKIRNRYQHQMECMYELLTPLHEHLNIEKAKGGMFLWARLHRMDSERLLHRCMQENLVFVPGHHFYTKEKDPHTIRLNFTKSSIKEIEKGINLFKKVLNE